MAGPWYVRSTTGNDTNNGLGWSTAFATLKKAMETATPGDTVYVSQVHNESQATAMTIAGTGTVNAPLYVICATDTAAPPTSVAYTGAVSTTGGNTITINGSHYMFGLTITAGSTATVCNLNLGDTGSSTNQVYDNCKLRLGTSAAAARINVWSQAGTRFRETTVRFSNASQRMVSELGRMIWERGGLESGGVVPTTGLVSLGSSTRRGFLEASGLDLSVLGNNPVVFASNACDVAFKNVKMGTAWNSTLFSGAVPNGARVGLYNFNSTPDDDTNYKIWLQDYFGTLREETVIVRQNGATDGTTPISWKITTTANTTYPVGVFETPEMVAWNNSVGSPKTIAIDIIHDSLTPLTTRDIWVDVQFLGTSGFPQSLFVSDDPSYFTTASSNQTTSTAIWTITGLGNPNTQKLNVTVTPNEKGFILAKVKVAKPSYTVYVDPKIQIA